MGHRSERFRLPNPVAARSFMGSIQSSLRRRPFPLVHACTDHLNTARRLLVYFRHKLWLQRIVDSDAYRTCMLKTLSASVALLGLHSLRSHQSAGAAMQGYRRSLRPLIMWVTPLFQKAALACTSLSLCVIGASDERQVKSAQSAVYCHSAISKPLHHTLQNTYTR
jgi:hypothetical protein